MRPALASLLFDAGVIVVRDHPRQARTIQRSAAAGELVSLFPGVFVAATATTDPLIRLRAACAWQPDAALTGATALGFWAETYDSEPIHLVAPKTQEDRYGVTFSRRTVPDDLCRSVAGIKVVHLAYALVEHCPVDDGMALAQALSDHRVTREQVLESLGAFRSSGGIEKRRRIVQKVLKSPKMAAEMRLHRILLSERLGAFCSRHRFEINGNSVSPIVLFPLEKVVIELLFGDEDPDLVAKRHNLYVRGGFRCLFLTERQLRNPAQVKQTVRAVLAQTVEIDARVSLSGYRDFKRVR